MIASILRRVFARAALSLLLAVAPIAARADQSSIVTPQAGPHSMADFTTNFLNPALRALLSCSSGAAPPTNGPSNAAMAGQCWLDTSTTPLTLRIYDGAQWLAFATVDATGHILALPNATLSGTVKIPALTGYLYSAAGGLNASTTIPAATINGFILAANFPALTGDVTTPGGSLATTIQPGVVTAAKMSAGAALANLAANSVDATKMFQAPAATLRGNPTGATGNVSDNALTAYSDAETGSTATGGIISRGASKLQAIAPGTSGYVLTSQGPGATPSYQPTGSAGQAPQTPQGRLTLASGGPVLSSTVTGAPSIIYTPYVGNQVSLWNGTAFVPTPFTETSQALSDATKSPSAAAAGNVYDLFGWSDGGTFRVTRGPAWSAGTTAGSNTARGAGAGSTALTRQAGMLVNAFAITNGPAAGYGTYLGTIVTDAGGATVSFNPGGPAAGGTAAVIGLWNTFNRVTTGGSVRDTTSSWTYATTGTWRASNNSAGMRLTFVVGLPEDSWSARYNALQTSSASGQSGAGIGLDTTTSLASSYGYVVASSTAAPAAEYPAPSSLLGLHFLSAIEITAAGTMTGYGNTFQTGLNWSGRY